MKKIALIIILLLSVITIFFIGWIQFSVPSGKYGVFSSKTNGIFPITVSSTAFCWKWERLIPTNSTLLIFELNPKTYKKAITGSLPSANIYSQMLEGNPIFNWHIDVKLVTRINPDILPQLVQQFGFKDQVSIDEWSEDTITTLINTALHDVLNDLLRQTEENSIIMVSTPGKLTDLLNQRISGTEQQYLEIIEFNADFIEVPDFSLYSMAAKTYTEYQQRKSILLAEAASTQAKESITEYLQIERFERWGEVLTKYPILIDFLAVSRNDAAEVFSALKQIR